MFRFVLQISAYVYCTNAIPLSNEINKTVVWHNEIQDMVAVLESYGYSPVEEGKEKAKINHTDLETKEINKTVVWHNEIQDMAAVLESYGYSLVEEGKENTKINLTDLETKEIDKIADKIVGLLPPAIWHKEIHDIAAILEGSSGSPAADEGQENITLKAQEPNECSPTVCTYNGVPGVCSVSPKPPYIHDVGDYIVHPHECKGECKCFIEDDPLCITFRKKDCGLPSILLHCPYFCHQDYKSGIAGRGFVEDITSVWEAIKSAVSKGWDFLSKLGKSLTKKVNENLVLGCKPMTYNGVFHTGCTLHGSNDGREWCGVDGGIFWPGISNWKYC